MSNADKIKAAMFDDILTCTLSSGIEASASRTKQGNIFPKQYANLTSAYKAANKLGEGWTVYGVGRPFTVGRVKVSKGEN